MDSNAVTVTVNLFDCENQVMKYNFLDSISRRELEQILQRQQEQLDRQERLINLQQQKLQEIQNKCDKLDRRCQQLQNNCEENKQNTLSRVENQKVYISKLFSKWH